MRQVDTEAAFLLASELKALDEPRRQHIAAGWRLARVVRDRLDPAESEVHRQAVEDADDVLEYFAAEGFLKSGAEDAVMEMNDAVQTSIGTLESRVYALLGPGRVCELLGPGSNRS